MPKITTGGYRATPGVCHGQPSYYHITWIVVIVFLAGHTVVLR